MKKTIETILGLGVEESKIYNRVIDGALNLSGNSIAWDVSVKVAAAYVEHVGRTLTLKKTNGFSTSDKNLVNVMIEIGAVASSTFKIEDTVFYNIDLRPLITKK